MTGFRVALGGAQSLFGIRPDITILGKIIGGGLPVGALGGRREFMEMLAPVGPVYQAGTLSGNHLTMAAGLATLSICQSESETLYAHLNACSQAICAQLETAAHRHRIPLQTQSVGGMFGFFFSEDPVNNYEQACQSNTNRFAAFFNPCLLRAFTYPHQLLKLVLFLALMTLLSLSIPVMQSIKRWLVFNVDVACCAECCQLPYLDFGFLLSIISI